MPHNMSRRGNNYVLRVRGTAMSDDGFLEGDRIVVNSRLTAENGEMVVIFPIDGERAAVKRYYRERGYIRLESPTGKSEPIVLPSAQGQIQAVVNGLIRHY